MMSDFIEKNKIVHQLQAPTTEREEAELFAKVRKTVGVGYDFFAIFYWCIRALMRVLFNIPIPKDNPLNKPELLYCVEVLEALEDYLLELGVDLEDVEFSMLSPEQAFLLLTECDNLRELPC